MTAIPTLTTERLILRAPVPEDADALAAFYGSEASRYVGGPMTTWESWRYLSEVIGHWTMRGFGRWIGETRETGETVGLIGLHHPLDWPEAEVGWMLFPGQTGKGYGTEAGLAARAYAYERLSWPTLISLIDPANAASIALAERMGARQDRAFTHVKYGAMGIWRHPSPAELAA